MSRKAKLHRTQPRPKSSDRRVKQRPPVRANRGFSYIQRKGAQRTGKGAFVRFHLTPTLKRLAEGKGDIQAYLQWYGFGHSKITEKHPETLKPKRGHNSAGYISTMIRMSRKY